MKQKISKILVALDGSERSIRGLKEAIYLARQCGATITGLCVTPFYTINLGPLLTSLNNQTLKEAKQFMADAKKLCAQHGIVFHEKIIFGNESTLTANERYSVVTLDGANYTVYYSDIHSPLQRFSITSLQPITGDWKITLENNGIEQKDFENSVRVNVKYVAEDKQLLISLP